MTDKTLDALLADYAAPIPDDGFTDALMSVLPPPVIETAPTVSLDSLRRPAPWRAALMATALSAAAALAYVLLPIEWPSVTLPDADPSQSWTVWWPVAALGVASVTAWLLDDGSLI